MNYYNNVASIVWANKMLETSYSELGLTKEQLLKVQELAKVKIKDSTTFKKIYKKYPLVPDFTPFENIASRLTALVALADFFGIKSMASDSTIVNMILSAKLTELDPTPVYWLDKKLMEAFLNTDLPKDLYFIKKVLPRFILMTPKVLKSHEEAFLDFVIVEQYDNEVEQTRPIKFKTDAINIIIEPSCKKVSWRTVMSNEVVYTSTVELVPDEEYSVRHGEFHYEKTFKFSTAEPGLDKEFSRIVEKIVLLTLIYLQTENNQNNASEIQQIITKGSGFGKNAKKPIEIHKPIWIGKGYQTETRKPINEIEERESRKYDIHTHDFMRRGHLRRVVVGKREDNQREWRWIPPVRIIR